MDCGLFPLQPPFLPVFLVRETRGDSCLSRSSLNLRMLRFNRRFVLRDEALVCGLQLCSRADDEWFVPVSSRREVTATLVCSVFSVNGF